ncbi:DNA-binding anti-repressor SinI [Alicyclobacillus fastidiosus]|uniref:DNA-binding anti-repressor SinI n=1 Tax=Alicyclobacillus fastidiosus TaxID=392011 RepID=A0ABV5AAX2_9BACL|nr:DNA-binding anti-repressor SinI [Alicyclobacillus fastidiosus]WEH07640.1 DNA-binding anti-repressor SinI [Alicyclobacillus fastidiosus]
MLLDAEKREQNEPTLDIEWLQLVLMAREIGLSTEEVRLFLQQKIEHSV